MKLFLLNKLVNHSTSIWIVVCKEQAIILVTEDIDRNTQLIIMMKVNLGLTAAAATGGLVLLVKSDIEASAVVRGSPVLRSTGTSLATPKSPRPLILVVTDK